MKTWNIEAITGYKPITTFYMDFEIADHFGAAAIKDTFRRAFRSWKSDYKYLTELCMVLNAKIWEHYDGRNMYYAEIYNEIWNKACEYAENNLTGEAKRYYYEATD